LDKTLNLSAFLNEGLVTWKKADNKAPENIELWQALDSIRGKFMDYAPKFLSRKIKTFTIFHPSYLMRQSSKKKVAWQDMLALEQFLQTR
jgi:uracil-DNA glycosylase family 4